jgi:hypothetical protein
MAPEKLKAHKYDRQGKKFQSYIKLLAAQHKQKSMGLPVCATPHPIGLPHITAVKVII